MTSMQTARLVFTTGLLASSYPIKDIVRRLFELMGTEDRERFKEAYRLLSELRVLSIATGIVALHSESADEVNQQLDELREFLARPGVSEHLDKDIDIVIRDLNGEDVSEEIAAISKELEERFERLTQKEPEPPTVFIVGTDQTVH